MDKRWLIILIILIAGLGAMYHIATTSTNVGCAVTIVHDLSVTVPHGFKIAESSTDYTKLIDDRTNETIELYYLVKGDESYDTFKKEVDSLNNDSDCEILDSSNDNGVYKISYKDSKNLTQTHYITCLCNRTIVIIMTGFDNPEKEIKELNFIKETVEPDYKQKHD